MNEVKKEIEKEEIKKAVEGHKEEDAIKKFANDLVRSFKAISEEQKNSKSKPNKDQREYNQAVEMDNLTFLDGVLLTWNIFNKILDKRLRDENGDPEKGVCNGHDYEYLGIINDDIAEFILDKVLEQGYFKNRGYQLMYQFGIEII